MQYSHQTQHAVRWRRKKVSLSYDAFKRMGALTRPSDTNSCWCGEFLRLVKTLSFAGEFKTLKSLLYGKLSELTGVLSPANHKGIHQG